MTGTKRPSGYSEILDPTEDQIADLQTRKESGELARLIFDRTTRGRVRAVWFRRAAKKLGSGEGATAVLATDGVVTSVTITNPGHGALSEFVYTLADPTALVDSPPRPDATHEPLPSCAGPSPVLRINYAAIKRQPQERSDASSVVDAPEVRMMTMDGQHLTPLAYAEIEDQRREVEAEIKRQEQIDEPEEPFLDIGTIIRITAVAFIASTAFFYWWK